MNTILHYNHTTAGWNTLQITVSPWSCYVLCVAMNQSIITADQSITDILHSSCCISAGLSKQEQKISVIYDVLLHRLSDHNVPLYFWL